jgi:hypothetical protein
MSTKVLPSLYFFLVLAIENIEERKEKDYFCSLLEKRMFSGKFSIDKEKGLLINDKRILFN